MDFHGFMVFSFMVMDFMEKWLPNDNIFKGEGRFKFCNEAMNMINKWLQNKCSESDKMDSENKAQNVVENRF